MSELFKLLESNNPKEVTEAREKFYELLSKGYDKNLL